MSKARNKKSVAQANTAVIEADVPVLEATRFEEEEITVVDSTTHEEIVAEEVTTITVVETTVEQVLIVADHVEEVTVVDVAEEITVEEPEPEQVLEVQPAPAPEEVVELKLTPEQLQAKIAEAVAAAIAAANPKKAPKRSKDKMEVAGACVALYGYETPITREMIDYINDNYGIANDQTSMACLKAARATLRGYAEPIRVNV